ncbi:MAG: metallopeptidase family protein [Candidatus Jorgensenbacteria bacterium]
MGIPRNAFLCLVEKGIARIPARFLEELENVAVIVEDEPTRSQLRELGMRRGDLLLGLYEGVPHTAGGHAHRTYPDKITLFRNHIEVVARGEGDVARVVAETVRHEIAHHLVMEEHEVRRAERRRPRRMLQ